MTTPLISLDGVSRSFGGVAATEAVSLDVGQGEFLALLGPSGCGKTTLLRLIAGFEIPDAGTIRIDGEDMTGVPPWRRPVNTVFQSYALFPHLSVASNIAFGLRQDRLPKWEIDLRVAEMLALVRLEDQAGRKPHQLSGGQRQRVALARSVAKRPKVLLLDEPLGALDKKLREETQFELMDLQQDLGLTFMVVTHDQEEAMTMADRIAIMDKGEVMQVATPAEIYEAPSSRFVADFVGSVNLFEGKVAGQDAGRVKIATASGFDIQAEESAAPPAGETVWYAVRPEKIRISSQRPETAVNAVEGEVWDIGYLGDMTVYNVKLANGQIVRSSQLNAHRTTADPLTWNDRAWLAFPADAGVVLTR